MIKFWTYKNEYSKYSKKLLKVINDTINNGTIFFGKELNKFEKKFKKTMNKIFDLKFFGINLKLVLILKRKSFFLKYFSIK